MTIEEAYKKITSSEELKKAAIEALKSGKGNEFLKEHGFDLTIDQINDALKNKKGELSKDELNAAAGGCSYQTCNDLKWSFGTFGVGCAVSAIKNQASDVAC